MADRLFSRAEVARLKGVSKPAITKACRGALAPACAEDRINIDHPAAREYLGAAWPKPSRARAHSDAAPTKPARSRTKAPRKPPAPGPAGAPAGEEVPAPPTPVSPIGRHAPELDESGYAEELREWTLFEIATRFGTLRAFKDHLEAHEKLERARKLRLDNEETEGRLIERELVKTHVMGAIEGTNRRLLTDTPKTLARTLYAMHAAGASLEEAEAQTRRLIGDQLTPVRDKAIRLLRKPKPKKSDPQGEGDGANAE
jgi:hypothetical protein